MPFLRILVIVGTFVLSHLAGLFVRDIRLEHSARKEILSGREERLASHSWVHRKGGFAVADSLLYRLLLEAEGYHPDIRATLDSARSGRSVLYVYPTLDPKTPPRYIYGQTVQRRIEARNGNVSVSTEIGVDLSFIRRYAEISGIPFEDLLPDVRHILLHELAHAHAPVIDPAREACTHGEKEPDCFTPRLARYLAAYPDSLVTKPATHFSLGKAYLRRFPNGVSAWDWHNASVLAWHSATHELYPARIQPWQTETIEALQEYRGRKDLPQLQGALSRLGTPVANVTRVP